MAEAKSENPAMHHGMKALAPPQGIAMEMGSVQYRALRQVIFETGQPFVTPRCRIVDLRCGKGEFVEPFIERNEDLCRFIMLDPSSNNIQSCMQRFHMRMHLGFVQPAALDLNKDFPDLSSRLTICMGGLGPLPIERRVEVLGEVRRHLEKGGAFIMAEALKNEDDCASWLGSLREAGFDSIERIWTSGNICAWMARKKI
ncbi:MAG: class I SAM-dependent methyltransferase [Methanomassiliicoccales archaeon]|nr:class I SAM-dependent methyltransferase [Methanomassiliicoccales archaeon]MDD1755873.1 class I SAM-dependent methyltransferase [Methanomassiliicoccales archaeon]